MGIPLHDRRFVLAALAVAVGSSRAFAQAPPRAVEILYVESLESRVPETLRRLRAYVDRTRAEGGALSSVALQELGRPERLAAYTVWRDSAALTAHLAGASRKGLDGELAASIQAPIDDRVGGVVSVEPLKAGRNSLYVLTHIDVAPPGANDAAGWLREQATAALPVAGCQGFEVSVQPDHTNHFTLAQAWRDRPAFAAYAASDAARRVRSRLSPIKGALYDERFYKAV